MWFKLLLVRIGINKILRNSIYSENIMEVSKINLPWTYILPYMSYKDLSTFRRVSKSCNTLTTDIFTPAARNEILYQKFISGISTKGLSNTNYTSLLHPYAIPLYEKIKGFRKNMLNKDGKITINGTLFDFPNFVYETFTHFVQPDTGVKYKADELIKNKLTDPKSYANIFHTTDFKVILTNSQGHTLKMPKQWLMPMGVDDLEDSVEETKQKYEAFYKESDKEMSPIDYTNQAMINKRQGKLLELASTKKVDLKLFELIQKVGLWIILMCEGGSFSIGIFNGSTLISHKSDKKYLIRKKAGKRQANKDKSKKVMTSVGSMLRREMEKVHQEHVANIMEECKKYLEEAVVIFLHAPGINRSFFLTEGMPLKPYVNKIKPIIVHTKKANFENVMEVFEKLISVNLTFSSVVQ